MDCKVVHPLVNADASNQRLSLVTMKLLEHLNISILWSPCSTLKSVESKHCLIYKYHSNPISCTLVKFFNDFYEVSSVRLSINIDIHLHPIDFLKTNVVMPVDSC